MGVITKLKVLRERVMLKILNDTKESTLYAWIIVFLLLAHYAVYKVVSYLMVCI